MVILRTGSKPINAETPADALWDHDLTPAREAYIRCHGSIPQLKQDHEISFVVASDAGESGQDLIIATMSVQSLKEQFQKTEIWMKMICDGNRRKELNNLRAGAFRTYGFRTPTRRLSTSSRKIFT